MRVPTKKFCVQCTPNVLLAHQVEVCSPHLCHTRRSLIQAVTRGLILNLVCRNQTKVLFVHQDPQNIRSGRGMDLNPELLSAIDRLCVGLVVQCMFQCREHNLNSTNLQP